MPTKRPAPHEHLEFSGVMDKLFNPQRELRELSHRKRGLLARRGRGARGRIPCAPALLPGSAFVARFGLSRIPFSQSREGEVVVAPTADCLCFRKIQPTLRHGIVPFLAPHEVLHLLRCSKSHWGSYLAVSARERYNMLLESTFVYFRLSSEAVDNVTNEIPGGGGWRTFLPILVGLCEELARIYGHLEPDPAHRAILAEQACFSFGKRRRFGLGRLASWEIEERERERELISRGFQRFMSEESSDDDEPSGDNQHRPFSVAKVKNVEHGQVCWGDAGPCIIRGDRELGEWLERSREWMMENAHGHGDDKPNNQYRLRLKDGLHPPIWILCRPEMYIEYALAIGPNREQSVVNFSSYYASCRDTKAREEMTKTFWSCFDPVGPRKEGQGGSFVEFLVNHACPADPSLDEQPTKCMAIWCVRRGLEPFNDKSIDWATVFRHDDRFLLEALSSSEFGPANFENYKE